MGLLLVLCHVRSCSSCLASEVDVPIPEVDVPIAGVETVDLRDRGTNLGGRTVGCLGSKSPRLEATA
eukprot:15203933-Alexandrium_andersonii.AAC.1